MTKLSASQRVYQVLQANNEVTIDQIACLTDLKPANTYKYLRIWIDLGYVTAKYSKRKIHQKGRAPQLYSIDKNYAEL
jgi:predicted transcriptional regulator